MGGVEQCSWLHLQAYPHIIMQALKVFTVILAIAVVSGRRQLRNNVGQREERSLVGTFPFNQGDQRSHHDHHHHHDHAEAGASAGSDGKKCIDKVEMVEETEYDDVVQCDHSYDKRCHTTYVTNYESQQEEECEENFRKS